MDDEGAIVIETDSPAIAPPGAPLRDLASVRAFVLAGHAVFTVVSKRSGERRTFRVRRAGELRRPGGVDTHPIWFVDLLTGPDNTHDYTYVGFLRAVNDTSLVYRQKQGVNKVMQWLAGRLNDVGSTVAEARFFEQCEVWHEGRCGRCGRALTDPESIARGIGPVCADKE